MSSKNGRRSFRRDVPSKGPFAKPSVGWFALDGARFPGLSGPMADRNWAGLRNTFFTRVADGILKSCFLQYSSERFPGVRETILGWQWTIRAFIKPGE